MNEKEVFNVDTGKTETIRFLRMNIILDYSMTMGSVDLADQLQRNSHINIGVRNKKWWWSNIFWSIGVMLTNSYIIYVEVDMSNRVEKRDLISHHAFHRAIALAWINPTEYRGKCTTRIATISTRNSSKRQSSSVSTASSITMDSSLERESKRARRVCDQ